MTRLTTAQREVLGWIAKNDCHATRLERAEMTVGERNSARALLRRNLVRDAGLGYAITTEGRQALAATPGASPGGEQG